MRLKRFLVAIALLVIVSWGFAVVTDAVGMSAENAILPQSWSNQWFAYPMALMAFGCSTICFMVFDKIMKQTFPSY